MNAIPPTICRSVNVGLAGLAALLLLSACHQTPSSDANAVGKAGDASAHAQSSGSAAAQENDKAGAGAEEGISLKAEEVEALGIVTSAALAAQSSPEASGFAVVVAHETIAQAVTELRTATAAARQSRAALERVRQLVRTPGAMPAEARETTERQAASDQAALDLAWQHLYSAFGQDPPWKGSQDSPELLALATGQYKLVRVTFPLGSLGGDDPGSVRLARIDSSQGGKSWLSRSVWRAPADINVPGRSFFALLKSRELGEGEHLLAWAPVGEPESGALVPAPAAVISGGKFYCYIEKKPGTFVRTEFDPGRPTADGYFVREGITAGDKIVTTAAGQLLAREINPSKEAE
jgi:hypothetical protein